MLQNFTKESKSLFLLWLAALGLRILYNALFTDELIASGDQVQNIMLGRRFGSGDFYGVLHTYWTPVYPVLIGIVSFFTSSLVLPALIVSIIAGSLAIPLIYFFVNQSYGQTAGFIAAGLAVFYPHLTNAAVFEIGSENVYLLWIIGALFVGWKALQENLPSCYVLTGVLLGLAYLTRPEAIAYPFYFVALAVIKNLLDKKPLSRGLILRIAALLLSFAVFATPYIFYLKSETGSWTISGKAQANIGSGILAEDNQKPDNVISEAAAIKSIIKELPISFIGVHESLKNLLPLFLLALIGLGLFHKSWSRKRLEREVYLIVFCFITFLGYAATAVQTRYFYILLPIFFGWMALGLIHLQKWFYDSVSNRFSNREISAGQKNLFVILCLISIYLYTFPLNHFINKRDAAFEERAAGLWLKANGKPAPFVYSASLLPVFYAEGTKLMSPVTDQEEILNLIKSNQLDYVISSERSLIRNPYLKGFEEKLENSSDFELIYREKDRTKYTVSIFKFKK